MVLLRISKSKNEIMTSKLVRLITYLCNDEQEDKRILSLFSRENFKDMTFYFHSNRLNCCITDK